MNHLFEKKLNVINIGLASFKETLEKNNVPSAQVDFKPSLEVNLKAKEKMALSKAKIDQANVEAIQKVFSARPYLVNMGQALDLIPHMKKNKILHAGPPITWEKMCGPMKGGVIGALIYEGLAQTFTDAEKLVLDGKIEFAPCHEHNSVGPMAGIISASMPVFEIKNDSYSAFTTQNEGLGKVLRYGAYSEEVIKRLQWMEDVLYPNLKKAILSLGKIDLKTIMAQALHMGDEVHNRNRAATSLFYRTIAPALIDVAENKKIAIECLNFINSNDHFFLNLCMAAAKASLMPAIGTPFSTLVTTMSRNGTEFGIQLAGTGKNWYTGPAPVPDALFFKGYTKDDANPDIGDSAITETLGVGGFAIAASPAIVQFIGGQATDAINYTLQMYEITMAENNVYQIPGLDFRGTPTGIDVRKVIDKNILPFIDTGVAHKMPGVGQVGAGVLSAPSEPFIKAYEAFVDIAL